LNECAGRVRVIYYVVVVVESAGRVRVILFSCAGHVRVVDQMNLISIDE